MKVEPRLTMKMHEEYPLSSKNGLIAYP